MTLSEFLCVAQIIDAIQANRRFVSVPQRRGNCQSVPNESASSQYMDVKKSSIHVPLFFAIGSYIIAVRNHLPAF